MTKYSCTKHITHSATAMRDKRTNKSKFGISLLANVGSPLPRVMPSAIARVTAIVSVVATNEQDVNLTQLHVLFKRGAKFTHVL